MSYALASKKRKFHRVLESLSNNSNAPKPSPPKPIPKDPTVATPKSIDPTIKRVRLTPGSEPDDTVIRPSKSSLPSRSSTTSLRPNFVPWDRDRFLERLETFRRVDRWSPKPEAINEVQWAKRGWSCVDVMRVECVGGCGHSVVVKLPDDIEELEEYDSEKIEERKQVRTALVEEYVKLIVEGHGERCPWRRAGCDDSIHRLLLGKPENALKGLKERYTNLHSLAKKLPCIERIVLPQNMDMNELLKMIPPETFSTSDSESKIAGAEKETPQRTSGESEETPNEGTHKDINKSVLALALFGWDLCGDKRAGLASCNACFRRLGLWMYNPKEDGSSSIYPTLDVVVEHLDYCPWVNAKTQSGSEKQLSQRSPVGSALAGWEVLERVIRNVHRRKTWSADSEAGSAGNNDEISDLGEIDIEARKAKDREWWARLRRVRQALQVKGPKKSKGAA
ncbi:hypothetical protein CPC735_051250 [Coccidioides posadasii C735 delta SOWgp]|uniref:Uncharacterized protein n=1 Tax=Coccidioides posadasii (strain C735) TaxID=222929 RepID=C5PGV2_COCP7|nr:hypothetical protein CPC735_051250 [Coccidioides posadasii C735 delta SOWgp]EER23755.1 hypothetical protein CPC735_051250 [Coccidioides posadasii C735 delta SOWgp]|eukprot:XP_003065900.1 hypothetical protein CPC735_051250 [Coccidioides posadasii C735 delta SOWgp]